MSALVIIAGALTVFFVLNENGEETGPAIFTWNVTVSTSSEVYNDANTLNDGETHTSRFEFPRDLNESWRIYYTTIMIRIDENEDLTCDLVTAEVRFVEMPTEPTISPGMIQSSDDCSWIWFDIEWEHDLEESQVNASTEQEAIDSKGGGNLTAIIEVDVTLECRQTIPGWDDQQYTEVDWRPNYMSAQAELAE